MKVDNIFESLPRSSPEEVFDELLRRDGLRIERIVSFGQASPEGFWYDQESHEWVLLLRGAAGLELAGRDGIVELRPGDHLDIPAGLRHRVAWTAAGEPTVWLAVHYAVRSSSSTSPTTGPSRCRRRGGRRRRGGPSDPPPSGSCSA